MPVMPVMPATILIVEDTPHNLQLMQYLLEAAGFRVLSAETGEECLEMVQTTVPDLVIMDLQLPGISGFEALERLRAMPALVDVPVVAVTAYVMLGNREHALAAGFADFISKPIDPETFSDSIAGLMGRPASESGEVRRRVLVLDDLAEDVDVVREALGGRGYEVITTRSVEEAEEAIRSDTPDLVLSDYELTLNEGLHLVHRLRSDETLGAIPFALLAPAAGPDELSGTDVPLIHRPIDPVDLLARVEQMLGAAPAPALAPARAATLRNASAGTGDRPQPRPRGRGRGRVLVVDDLTVNLDVVRGTLGPHGYEVLTASTIEEAEETVRADRPDLVLSDVHIATQRGPQLYRRLRSQDLLGRIPFVFLSSTAEPGDIADVDVPLIQRPIAPEELVARVDAILAGPDAAGTAVTRGKAAAVAESPTRPGSGRRKRPGSRGRVLVVDDLSANLAAVNGTLAPHGYEVIMASTVEAAERWVRTDPPDLVLCDVHLASQRGRQLFRRLQSDPSLAGIPFAFLSSSADPGGLHDVDVPLIQRPIEPDALLARVEELLGERERA